MTDKTCPSCGRKMLESFKQNDFYFYVHAWADKKKKRMESFCRVPIDYDVEQFKDVRKQAVENAVESTNDKFRRLTK